MQPPGDAPGSKFTLSLFFYPCRGTQGLYDSMAVSRRSSEKMHLQAFRSPGVAWAMLLVQDPITKAFWTRFLLVKNSTPGPAIQRSSPVPHSCDYPCC